MTLKQFTVMNGSKILVNMDQVKHISPVEDNYVRICFSGDYHTDSIIVKGKISNILKWSRKQDD